MYKLRNKSVYTIIIAIVWLLSACFYILYGHRYNDWYRIIPMAILLIGYVILYLMWVNDTDREVPGWMRNCLRFTATMVAVGVFIGLIMLNQKYCTSQLLKYAVNVKGKVIMVDQHKYKGSITYYDILQYSYQNTTNIQKLRDNDHKFKAGDTVAFVCSSHDPQIIKVRGFDY